MLFPIADENDDRVSTPWVNYTIILINIFVFVFLQGLGTNDRFTYAFSTVPGEIITGRDIVTPDRILIEQITGQRIAMPGLQPTPIPVFLTLITRVTTSPACWFPAWALRARSPGCSALTFCCFPLNV